MTPRLLPAALLLCATAAGARTAAPPAASEVRTFGSAAEALGDVLSQEHPRVMAFGEYHEIVGGPKVPSAIRRFSEQLFPVVRPLASDLVLETWISEGKCGKQEAVVTKDVEKTTERPQTTESEIVTLAKRAKAAGVQPHALTLKCADYGSLLGKDGAVDYDKGLLLITTKLQGKITELLSQPKTSPPDKVITAYGGALHPALYPRRENARYAFGPAIRKATAGRYVEVDLYVPEYIDADKDLRKEAWYPMIDTSAGRTLLVRRGPGSYIIIFPRTPAPPAGATPPPTP